jgi:hypothetical protein
VSTIRSNNIERLNNGKVSGNLSQIYEDSANYDISQSDISEIKENILTTNISHPTDTHPSISERMASIGFDPAGLTLEKLTAVGGSSSDVLLDVNEIEKYLTLYEHKYVIALGYVVLPEDDDDSRDPLLNCVYSLAAAMVAADGKIAKNEIAIAEGIGRKLFPDFDSVDFRACCNDVKINQNLTTL